MKKKVFSLITVIIMLAGIIETIPIWAEDNSIINATPLAINNQWQSGYIGYDDQAYESDYYSVNVPSDGKLTINMQSFGRLEFYIFDSDFKSLRTYESYASAGDPSNDEFSEWLEDGIYYIQIKDRYMESSGDYRLKASFESADSNEIEPNDSYLYAQSLINGSVITGTMLYNNGDNYDYYKIDLTQKSNYYFILESFDFTANFKLYDSDLNDITGGPYIDYYMIYNGSISINYTLDKGMYYVRMDNYPNNGKYGKYTIKFGKLSVSASNSSSSNKSSSSKTVKNSKTVTKTKSSAKKLAKVSGLRLKRFSKKKAKIAWNKVSGANGYEVKWSSNKKFKKSKKKLTNKKTITIKKLKKKKYFIKVRAYKTVNGRKNYGKYSKVLKLYL